MKWEIKKLADCCVSITDGDHQPPPKAQKGIPFVTISNITTANQFDFSNTMYVSEEYYNHLDSKRKPQRGDILYSVVGSFGIPVYIKETIPFVFQRHIAILRPYHTILPQFLYYTMLNRDFYLMADAAAIGAAQRTVSLSALRNMKIAVPPINIQEKIVYLLSAYDNLIENNQKQIKLLEEAAQRLYKEWFVDLRFPGYETTPVVDGVPEGWKWTQLADIAAVNKRSISKDYSFEYIDYIDIGSVSAGRIESKTRYMLKDAPGRAKRVVCDGDVIWGMVRPNLKSYALVFHPQDTTIASTGFAVLSAKKVPFSFLYCHVIQDEFISYLVNCTNGAAYPAVKPIHFEEANILVPTNSLLEKFQALAEPMFKKIEVLSKQIEVAAEARDRLLPKLMSGELEV